MVATNQDLRNMLVENYVEVIDYIGSWYLVMQYMVHKCADILVGFWVQFAGLSSLSCVGSVRVPHCGTSVESVCEQCVTSVSEGTVAIGSKHDPISSTAPGRYFPQNLENLTS